MNILGLILVTGCALYAGIQIGEGNPAGNWDFYLVVVLNTIGGLLVLNN